MSYLSIVLTFLLGCGGPFGHFLEATPVADTYASPAIKVMVRSSVRIVVDCDLDGKPDHQGSGVAVGPRHILTARHVVEDCEEGSFTLTRWDGAKVAARFDAAAKDPAVDAARLVVAGPYRFATWAEVSYARPAIGSQVFIRAHDARMGGVWSFDRGFVGSVFRDQISLTYHGVPGNSGSGIFDPQGRVIGILWGGRWDTSKAFLTLAYRPRVWRDLMNFPPPDPDGDQDLPL